MKTKARLLLLFWLFPVAGWAESAPAPKPTLWPGGRAAAISLTFDDAMQSQIDNAAPVLAKHHLRGTFFVITGPSSTWRGRADDWRRLATEGNEIASHTVNHPCLLERIEPHSQDYSPEMMHKELRESAREITARLGTERGLTFAYPCGNMSFGPPAAQARNQALYIDDVAESYFAARGYGGGGDVDPEELNVLTVPDLGSTAGKPFPDLLAMMQPAVRGHRWGIFGFHGVGGQWLSVSTEALDELASYLERHTEIWTAPFGDVIRYIQESKALEIQPARQGEHTAEFSLKWPLDPKVFDLPLTLQWVLPPDCTGCHAEGDGRPLPCTVQSKTSPKMALVEVSPQTKTLQFETR
jgi:peptidoglycan/xylan/chitin deacetylase (PgdA/CDA1 family)